MTIYSSWNHWEAVRYLISRLYHHLEVVNRASLLASTDAQRDAANLRQIGYSTASTKDSKINFMRMLST